VKSIHRKTDPHGDVCQHGITQHSARVLDREDEVNSERPATPSDVREQVVRFGELAQEFVNLVDDDCESGNARRVLD
jgi:hypothetical protein